MPPSSFFFAKQKSRLVSKLGRWGLYYTLTILPIGLAKGVACVTTYLSVSSLLPSSSYEDANSLVTIGEGKFYSLGLDLEHMATMAPYELITFTSDLQKLLARLLTFPLVTVAAINGTYSFGKSQSA